MSQQIQSFIEHLNEEPWSDYTAADYSIEQWHAACLIHQHEGPPTSKSQCKLPVKTPNGAVNRNAVHSAAAALAGARGGVNASPSEKSSATIALVRYYHQMDEKPPPSLLKHSNIEAFVEHYGTKGMRWGVRKSGGPQRPAAESKRVKELSRREPHQLTNKQLKTINERLNLEKNYNKLNPTTLHKGQEAAKAIAGLVTFAGSMYALKNTKYGQMVIATGKKLVEKKVKSGQPQTFFV